MGRCPPTPSQKSFPEKGEVKWTPPLREVERISSPVNPSTTRKLRWPY